MTRQAKTTWADCLAADETLKAIARRTQIDRDARRAATIAQLDAENLRNAMAAHNDGSTHLTNDQIAEVAAFAKRATAKFCACFRCDPDFIM